MVFFTEANYRTFLRKISFEWTAYCDITGYSLLPNLFHFIVRPNITGCDYVVLKEKETHLQNLSKAIGKTLSSYAKAVNIQEGKSGTLFRKKTRAQQLMTNEEVAYWLEFIHNSPVKAYLVGHAGEWEFSSYKSYVKDGYLELRSRYGSLIEMPHKNA